MIQFTVHDCKDLELYLICYSRQLRLYTTIQTHFTSERATVSHRAGQIKVSALMKLQQLSSICGRRTQNDWPSRLPPALSYIAANTALLYFTRLLELRSFVRLWDPTQLARAAAFDAADRLAGSRCGHQVLPHYTAVDSAIETLIWSSSIPDILVIQNT